jgi:hypothetical protein
VALVGAGAIAWGAGRVARIERAARHLSAVGQDAKSLLESYGAGVQDGDVERILSLYESGYEGAVLGDWDVEVATNRDGVRVADWHPVDALPGELPAERLRRFLGGLGGLEMAKFKLDRVVSLGAEGTTVRGFLWLRGDRDTAHGEERYEMQGLVLVGLARAGRGEEWQIRDQQLVWGRTVSGPGRGFDDEAASRGVDFTAVRNPLFDTPEWSPDSFEIIRYGAAGVSAVDYDGDGWDDLFFADGAAARLYRSQGDGTFRDATEAAGLPTDLTGVNVGLFVDLDNDGDRDLFLGVFTGPNRLYRNEGEGRFTDVTEGAGLGGLMVTAASAADYDEDGLLDLYVGRYLDPRTELPDTLTYTRNGEGNSLLRNLGGLRFEDATEEADVREGGLTLGVAWADYDRDGDEDLYVANDFGRNALLRNEGDGRFSDVSAESGALDFGFGMSASWGDVDNDGDFDLYVSNVHSGQRWYSQAATLNQYLLTSLRQGTILEDFPLYREIHDFVGSDWHRFGDRMVKGNSLLLNDGAGRFAEVAETARANPFGWYWGSGMLDFDNDGRLDLYAGNGWITGETHDDL